MKFDVSDTAACAAAVDEVVKGAGRLDVLVNNAGRGHRRPGGPDQGRRLGPDAGHEPQGAFALCRAAARPMMKQRSGAIVNLTSVVGEMGNVGQAAYAASKAGLIGLTKSLARELSSRNIRVNAVSPGFIDTDMTAGVNAELKAKMTEAIPLGRLGTADEVARAVLFLASDAASYVTGEVLKVNGGMYM
jgi:3-oxoacyl-[acyl-carrier protein] reductase